MARCDLVGRRPVPLARRVDSCCQAAAALCQRGSRALSPPRGSGAADRWVMTLALLAVRACNVATGPAPRPADTPGRVILIADGVAGLLVAANPEPARGGSLTHGFWATIGFTALAAWPAGS